LTIRVGGLSAAGRILARSADTASPLPGCLIQGHAAQCRAEAIKGVAVGLDTGVPVVFGVIVAESPEQAMERRPRPAIRVLMPLSALG
jgi:6,7-dimethyl-8-ribityllumazine synthase